MVMAVRPDSHHAFFFVAFSRISQIVLTGYARFDIFPHKRSKQAK
jgi:hypothetical protein